jgi:hypothetical protein
LLTRPVGRPSNKPVVWFKSFLYHAASWTTGAPGGGEGRIPLWGVVPPRGLLSSRTSRRRAGGWCASTTNAARQSNG